MRPLVQLRHLHLPGLTHYLHVAALQDRLVRVYLDHKAAPNDIPTPHPTLLTFQTPPTYTCGRREVGRLSKTQIYHLKAGGKAEFYEALRGGQTTWHGPGQLTAYLIVSLKEHELNIRSHVALLENSVMATCMHFKLMTHTTTNPGVWVGAPPDDRKICSVGVHLRRNIASHGIGLNVYVDLSWFDRIVACGLVGKQATSIEKELKALYKDLESPQTSPWVSRDDFPDIVHLGKTGISAGNMEDHISMDRVADVFASSVAQRLSGVSHHVRRVAKEELWPG
jgi:lipoate-protein ligase B